VRCFRGKILFTPGKKWLQLVFGWKSPLFFRCRPPKNGIVARKTDQRSIILPAFPPPEQAPAEWPAPNLPP
jgi:hypothetical protein